MDEKNQYRNMVGCFDISYRETKCDFPSCLIIFKVSFKKKITLFIEENIPKRQMWSSEKIFISNFQTRLPILNILKGSHDFCSNFSNLSNFSWWKVAFFSYIWFKKKYCYYFQKNSHNFKSHVPHWKRVMFWGDNDNKLCVCFFKCIFQEKKKYHCSITFLKEKQSYILPTKHHLKSYFPS